MSVKLKILFFFTFRQNQANCSRFYVSSIESSFSFLLIRRAKLNTVYVASVIIYKIVTFIFTAFSKCCVYIVHYTIQYALFGCVL